MPMVIDMGREEAEQEEKLASHFLDMGTEIDIIQDQSMIDSKFEDYAATKEDRLEKQE